MLCTIEIEHSESSLHAHVELDGEIKPCARRPRAGPRPADQVVFGERLVLRRDATVERAGLA